MGADLPDPGEHGEELPACGAAGAGAGGVPTQTPLAKGWEVRALLRAVQQGLRMQKGFGRDAVRFGVHQGMGGSWVVLEGARWRCEHRIPLPALGEEQDAGWRRDGAVNAERQSGHDFSTAPGDSAL